jgi:hypothetical protein
MDAREWSASTNWLEMWRELDGSEAFDRKRRLIANGVCRRFGP